MTLLAILVPVLRRPHRVVPVLDSIEAATPERHEVVMICDPFDREQIEAVRADGRARLLIYEGNYAEKINEAVSHTSSDFVFLGADDLHFHDSWFPAARAKMVGTVGAVGTQDMCNARVIAGTHATHFLVARWYIEQFGTIDQLGKALHEGYRHEYVDDEFVATAKSRDAWAFAEDSVVEHLHPSAGKAPMDSLYAQQKQRMRQGLRLYRSRRSLWM